MSGVTHICTRCASEDFELLISECQIPDPALIRSMSALGRLAQPAEIAAVAVFLLSPDASYLTGATIEASGGWK